MITATAAMCVGAVKTNDVAACKFELDDVPTKIIVEMIASIKDAPDIIANEVEFLSVRTAGEGDEFDREPMRPIRSERPQLEPVNEEDLPF